MRKILAFIYNWDLKKQNSELKTRKLGQIWTNNNQNSGLTLQFWPKNQKFGRLNPNFLDKFRPNPEMVIWKPKLETFFFKLKKLMLEPIRDPIRQMAELITLKHRKSHRWHNKTSIWNVKRPEANCCSSIPISWLNASRNQ